MVGVIPKSSSWNLPPTSTQIRAITKLCMRLHIAELLEEKPSNRYEARRLIYELRGGELWEQDGYTIIDNHQGEDVPAVVKGIT